MTKEQARKLERGCEIFNLYTGEIVRFTWATSTPSGTIFCEGMDSNGAFRIWPNNKIGRM